MQITFVAARNVAVEDRIYMSFGESRGWSGQVEVAAKGAVISYGKGFEDAF